MQNKKQNNKSIAAVSNKITKINLETKENNWYKHLGRVHYLLLENHKLTDDDIFKYLINHFIECLDLEQKLLFLYFTRLLGTITHVLLIFYSYRYGRSWVHGHGTVQRAVAGVFIVVHVVGISTEQK